MLNSIPSSVLDCCLRNLTGKLMLQGFLQSRLMSAFRKFYGRYSNYQLSLSHTGMLSDIFHTNS